MSNVTTQDVQDVVDLVRPVLTDAQTEVHLDPTPNSQAVVVRTGPYIYRFTPEDHPTYWFSAYRNDVCDPPGQYDILDRLTVQDGPDDVARWVASHFTSAGV